MLNDFPSIVAGQVFLVHIKRGQFLNFFKGRLQNGQLGKSEKFGWGAKRSLPLYTFIFNFGRRVFISFIPLYLDKSIRKEC